MYIEVRGNKTYAATGGKDFDNSLPTVMFVHGSGLDHRSWALQTRWFAYNGYSVLAPDLPGHRLQQPLYWTVFGQRPAIPPPLPGSDQ